MASHDLRAPLTNILGRADLLEIGLGGEGRSIPCGDALSSRRYATSVRRMLATVQEITERSNCRAGNR